MKRTPTRLGRRTLLAAAMPAIAGLAGCASRNTAVSMPDPDRKWYEAAVRMRTLAESWGDQSYGAVLVLDGHVVGDGPSRVVQKGDFTAHAEREAIRDAQRRLGRQQLDGAVLYSTSKPCSACQRAAAEAGVSRMIFGAQLTDGGRPDGGQE